MLTQIFFLDNFSENPSPLKNLTTGYSIFFFKFRQERSSYQKPELKNYKPN